MASIGTLFPPATSATNHSATAASSANSAANGTDSLANQSTFLQLLVTQLQNQDPSQPMDGTTFVTQLAEFTDVEQNMGTRQDLDGISQQYLGSIPSESTASQTATTTGATPGTSATSGS